MSSSASRVREALSAFKRLQRAREKVFIEDVNGSAYVRKKIKEEFLKFKNVTNPTEVDELLKVAKESEEILRTKVIQAHQVKPNVYRLRSEHLQAKCFSGRELCENCTCGR